MRLDPQPHAPLRVLGLDPGLRQTGWGIVDVMGQRLSHVAHGVIAPLPTLSFSARLLTIFEGVAAIIEEYGPHEAAIEETFMNTNAASALKLGHARAAAMVPPAQAGLTVAEYAAKVVKKSLVGTGGADKSQIVFMVRRLLPTAGVTNTDAADALAVAITHVHARDARQLGT